jgi:hypothetical protein
MPRMCPDRSLAGGKHSAADVVAKAQAAVGDGAAPVDGLVPRLGYALKYT